MLWIVGSLSLIVAVYFGALYWARAARANQSSATWGFGALLIVLIVMGALLWLTDLLASVLGVPYFIQIWIACVIWFVVTLIAGIKTDSVFETKLPVRA
jgi:hypothetical protein